MLIKKPFKKGFASLNAPYYSVAGGGGGAQSIITVQSTGQYLTTTWTHTPTDVKKATLSYWLKFTNLGTLKPNNYLFTTASTGGNIFDNKFDGSAHYIVTNDAGGYSVQDNSASSPDTNWHHLCLQIDTTNGTTPVQFYLDGVSTGVGAGATLPSLNSDMGVTANGIASYIGEVFYLTGNANTVVDAKWAYVYLIDGQALTPSSFTTGTGGSIHPITYAGTYGANGFFLNGNGGTSGSVPDQSGQNNHWTAPNNITFSADLPT